MRKVNLKSSASHITEARYGNSNERIVGQDGNINAGSVPEVMAKMAEIASLIQNGEIYTDFANNPDTRSNREILEEAFHDKEKWAELGSGLAAELQERILREGFMRFILTKADLAEGSVPRFRIRTPNVRAILTRGVGMHWPQYVRDRYLTTDEFALTATPEVDILEMHQGSGDLLEDKLSEAYEAIFAGEDRVLAGMLRATSGIYNSPIYFSGAFTPTVLQGIRQSVTDWLLPAENLIVANDVVSDFLVGGDFSTWFDPVTKWEIVQTGRIGKLLGLNIITDGYREPEFQVLDRGEVFITSSPIHVGAYTDRGPVTSTPIEGANKGTNTRGWYLNEFLSVIVANAKAVGVAKRI